LVGLAAADRRTETTETGIAAAIKARETNSQEIDLRIPVPPSMDSAKPARFAIIPANADRDAPSRLKVAFLQDLLKVISPNTGADCLVARHLSRLLAN
jgi:hypothetical protein